MGCCGAEQTDPGTDLHEEQNQPVFDEELVKKIGADS